MRRQWRKIRRNCTKLVKSRILRGVSLASSNSLSGHWSAYLNSRQAAKKLLAMRAVQFQWAKDAHWWPWQCHTTDRRPGVYGPFYPSSPLFNLHQANIRVNGQPEQLLCASHIATDGFPTLSHVEAKGYLAPALMQRNVTDVSIWPPGKENGLESGHIQSHMCITKLVSNCPVYFQLGTKFKCSYFRLLKETHNYHQFTQVKDHFKLKTSISP